MKKKKVNFRLMAGFLLSIIFILISFKYDPQTIRFIAGLRNNFLDYIFLSVGFVSNVFIIFFFLMTLFLWKEHKRRWIFPLWLSSFLSVIVSFLIKIWIKRPRPFQEGVLTLGVGFNFIKDNFNVWNFSFPSFMSMLVFSALPVLDKEFRKFKHVWLIFACLVAFSRAYFGLHYLSDVLVGAAIGCLIGYVAVIIEERYELGLKIMRKLKIAR